MPPTVCSRELVLRLYLSERRRHVAGQRCGRPRGRPSTPSVSCRSRESSSRRRVPLSTIIYSEFANCHFDYSSALIIHYIHILLSGTATAAVMVVMGVAGSRRRRERREIMAERLIERVRGSVDGEKFAQRRPNVN